MIAPDAPSPQVSAPRRKTPWKWAAAIVLCGLAAWYICENAGRWKDRFVPRKLRTVDENRVYASGQIDRHLIGGVLSDHHIRVIVCLDADDLDDTDVTAEIRAANSAGIERHVDPLNGDGTGDVNQYAKAVEQIVNALNAGKTVLLHCSSGAQRSNGATFYFRVFIEHWNADDAAREMIRNSFSPQKNPALIPYLNGHMAEMAQLLSTKGVITQIPDPMPKISIQ
jgi:protein tyrosine phosphatase (PTP) superfamily phosphohydrolase (DUF442 family)